MQGFSVTNLKYCRLFYNYKPIRPRAEDELNHLTKNDLYQQLRRIPWGHIKLLIDKAKERREVQFYLQQSIENSWNRDVLALQNEDK